SSGWDETIRVTNVDSGKEILRIDEHWLTIAHVCWSKENKYVAGADWTNDIHVWDVVNEDLFVTLGGAAADINTMAWSPNEMLLASGTEDGVLRIWDIERKGALREFADHSSAINALAWSPTGDMLASGDEGGEIILWDATKEYDSRVVSSGLPAILSIDWAADGRNLHLWVPGGKGLLTGKSKGPKMLTLEISMGEVVEELEIADEFIYLPTLSPNGKIIVSGSRIKVERVPGLMPSSRIYLWDLETGNRLDWIQLYRWAPEAISWSPDGKIVVIQTFRNRIFFWDYTNNRLRYFTEPNYVGEKGISWSHDQRAIAIGGADGMLRIWRLPVR
ncbi:MAG: hypothetical protein OEV06_07045, partial [Anaerolineae bacterium]|nr:hypothetical protein [Anaerolineae bacterium]